jgi:hypothetical protein
MQSFIYIVIVIPILFVVVFLRLIVSFVKLLLPKNTDVDHRTINNHTNNWRAISETESRCIYGMPLVTNDDWIRWWVLKGFSDALVTHLNELGQEIKSKTCDTPLYKKHEWERLYQKYRMLCINHGIWNQLIGEETQFVPTDQQIDKEKGLYEKIDRSYIW